MTEEPTRSEDEEANVSRETLASVFGDDEERIRRAEDYVALLSTEGIKRGLIGPREVPRLWGRHVLGSAVLGELIAKGDDVIDVGSGAGLPGIPMALARPDLWVTLVEPMQRRVDFLEEVVTALGIDNVEVLRARAEEVDPRGNADVVVSRAVAPLGKLARWCLPLAKLGGFMLAIKGQSAAEEIERDKREIQSAGGGKVDLQVCGESKLVEPVFTVPTTAVRIKRVR
ncbi:16S rRNA (guanine(527)-N(7))-methyltransferase RsmG [Glycomyces buryatensis]|uniref:Ribosomal RNA small subunit methyltransferase G n=1 Tax=Glycomyces buryatensis TaxID=2570927 RepID=A0A4S8Q897_9ACTN|nr:16S rRNA (guanine(527)-N(7))-methyltransferase RsmG [Glycomyces buryatensis]THV40607.1 16S rRNA (guanine(527)-N(7))-methyltransferase RsmG [Glycomyces buryatensis]